MEPLQFVRPKEPRRLVPDADDDVEPEKKYAQFKL